MMRKINVPRLVIVGANQVTEADADGAFPQPGVRNKPAQHDLTAPALYAMNAMTVFTQPA